MAFNIDRYMSQLNERLMSAAQHALDEVGYTLNEIENAVENNPDRDDIKACAAEVKEKTKKAFTECWLTANHWSDHFDGLGGSEDADGDEKDEPTEDADGDNSDK